MVDRVLGVLGGMGPLASAHFMVRLTELTPATRDQDHIPAILWSDPRVPGRSESRPGSGTDPLPALLRGIAGLRQAGADAIVIPCNTAHGWYDAMQAAAGIPILHIVDAAAAEMTRLGVPKGPVGLMGTSGTLAMQLYQSRLAPLGWTCLTPDETEMATLVTPAIARVKGGDIAAAAAPLTNMAQQLIARGAATVILGCTEIPLAVRGDDTGLAVVDTIDALARAAIGWIRRKEESASF